MKRATTDPYLNAIRRHQTHIVGLYDRFADKKPVMLLDIQEDLIYALPYREYRAGLSKRFQASLKKQHAAVRSAKRRYECRRGTGVSTPRLIA